MGGYRHTAVVEGSETGVGKEVEILLVVSMIMSFYVAGRLQETSWVYSSSDLLPS